MFGRPKRNRIRLNRGATDAAFREITKGVQVDAVIKELHREAPAPVADELDSRPFAQAKKDLLKSARDFIEDAPLTSSMVGFLVGALTATVAIHVLFGPAPDERSTPAPSEVGEWQLGFDRSVLLNPMHLRQLGFCADELRHAASYQLKYGQPSRADTLEEGALLAEAHTISCDPPAGYDGTIICTWPMVEPSIIIDETFFAPHLAPPTASYLPQPTQS